MRLGRVWLLAVVACGGARKECPRSNATTTQLDAAREHGARALARTNASIAEPHVWDQPYAGRTWYPWAYYWDPDLEYARVVATGLDQTRAFERVYRAACHEVPQRARERSALDTYALDITRVPDGVILHLEPEVGPPEALLVGLRCHHAWLRLIPRVEAGEDVLAVDGVKVVVHAGAREGIDISFTTAAPGAASEIERRARVAVTRAKRLRDVQPQ